MIRKVYDISDFKEQHQNISWLDETMVLPMMEVASNYWLKSLPDKGITDILKEDLNHDGFYSYPSYLLVMQGKINKVTQIQENIYKENKRTKYMTHALEFMGREENVLEDLVNEFKNYVSLNRTKDLREKAWKELISERAEMDGFRFPRGMVQFYGDPSEFLKTFE